MLAEACRQASEWERAFGRELNVSVNVSARQLARSLFPDEVSAVLGDADLDPRRLTLEITETAVATEGVASLEIIRALVASGVALAIDDFGIGFSSLERLERLPVTVLKIDKSFVAALSERNDARLLRGFRSLADAMGIETVVEGIETAEQFDALVQLGYGRGQRFYMSRPLHADAMTARLAAEPPRRKTPSGAGSASGGPQRRPARAPATRPGKARSGA